MVFFLSLFVPFQLIEFLFLLFLLKKLVMFLQSLKEMTFSVGKRLIYLLPSFSPK
jgi:hypothetical protein